MTPDPPHSDAPHSTAPHPAVPGAEATTVPRPFGRALCAMVTPFTAAGELDLAGARALAALLVAEGCDGLVLSGTTGESATTTDAEKTALVRAVCAEVGDRAAVLAGVGSADTRHTLALAREAERAGAHGLLVVAPYYSRPPQRDVEAHFLRIADASGVPLMLYDIPARTGTRIEPGTLLRLAAHPRVVAVKDCAYDLFSSSKVIARTSLAYYSGCEELNLPLYAVGGAGFVSTVANAALRPLRAVLDAYDTGARAESLRLHQAALPLVESMMGAGLPGTVTAKALLGALGRPAGPVREPLRPAGRETADGLLRAYAELTAAARAV
ncbi:4-hydroxy-tetrahydrodipicolinate synthase [Streptomyces sp. NBC_01429]|uniref:4-hydroxy-tetrahydrodipicolinate synthase n=1 Tax=Streptomyces sp. NBC_01429 TaxID=2903862 RepID=UPI002E2A13ED|nr:4-hydroxy-tetrahydrodipicolinate synthase [Streptomyces sp. NBC_01429]